MEGMTNIYYYMNEWNQQKRQSGKKLRRQGRVDMDQVVDPLMGVESYMMAHG